MTLAEQIQQQLSTLPPDKQNEVLDFVTFLQKQIQASRSTTDEAKSRERLKKAFEALAEMGTFSDITDPVEWQRQIRKDKPLFGREE